MNWKQHFLVGLFVTIVFIGILIMKFGGMFTILEYILFLGICYIYSQLPDIDIQSSKIRWIITSALLIVILIALLIGNTGLAILLLALTIFMWTMRLVGFGHRTICHTYTAAFLLSLPLVVFGVIPFVVGMLNFWSHLLADGRKK